MHLTEKNLLHAMVQWETAARTRECRPREEAEKLPVEQVAKENTAFLWNLLTNQSTAE